ncbi:C2 domain-containing protein [Forsythia ovata]|uniref:C2 domain-containing protein n=1 Tax=Forsythia ovata TaxID=205694 RepID=A0ABD1VEM9_9LAMI
MDDGGQGVGDLHGKLEVNVIVREPRYRVLDPYYAPYDVPPLGTRDYAAAPPSYGNPYAAPTALAYAAPPSGYPYGAPSDGQPGYGQPSYGQGGYYGTAGVCGRGEEEEQVW